MGLFKMLADSIEGAGEKPKKTEVVEPEAGPAKARSIYREPPRQENGSAENWKDIKRLQTIEYKEPEGTGLLSLRKISSDLLAVSRGAERVSKVFSRQKDGSFKYAKDEPWSAPVNSDETWGATFHVPIKVNQVTMGNKNSAERRVMIQATVKSNHGIDMAFELNDGRLLVANNGALSVWELQGEKYAQDTALQDVHANASGLIKEVLETDDGRLVTLDGRNMIVIWEPRGSSFVPVKTVETEGMASGLVETNHHEFVFLESPLLTTTAVLLGGKFEDSKGRMVVMGFPHKKAN